MKFSRDFSHTDVFGHLTDDTFTAQEAAEYLEVSIATFRRYVQGGKLKPAAVVGRSQMFATRDLKVVTGRSSDYKFLTSWKYSLPSGYTKIR